MFPQRYRHTQIWFSNMALSFRPSFISRSLRGISLYLSVTRIWSDKNLTPSSNPKRAIKHLGIFNIKDQLQPTFYNNFNYRFVSFRNHKTAPNNKLEPLTCGQKFPVGSFDAQSAIQIRTNPKLRIKKAIKIKQTGI